MLASMSIHCVKKMKVSLKFVLALFSGSGAEDKRAEEEANWKEETERNKKVDK